MAGTKDFKGKWALVTGASSGIGVALARELARHGAKLALTARREDRLEALAAELRTDGAEVRVIKANLLDQAAPVRIFDDLAAEGIEVEILINNAGIGQYGAFIESPAEQELSQVSVNCDAIVRLTRLFLPRMVAQGQGWIMVVASTASFQPVPYLSTYAATKAFARFFALGIGEEVARYGVKVTALCPGPTKSEFFTVARAHILESRGVQSAEAVARIGLDALANGRHTVVPNVPGQLTSFLVRFIPVKLIIRVIELAMRPAST